MPSIAPLTADQVAELYGAMDEFVGTGDNSTTSYALDYVPVVGPRSLADDIIGLGDGVATAYQINFYPVSPGTLTLRRGSIVGPALSDPADYSVNLGTGAVTLTPAGVTFLGLETLRASYSTPTTLELHRATISGPSLVEGTHYSVDYQAGTIELTPAGVTFLGTDQLHARYQVSSGLVNVLTEANASLGTSIVQAEIQEVQVGAKDDSLRYIHESIETKAILDLEAERRNMDTPGVTVTSPVIEADIYGSVDLYAAPLYPTPPPGDPALPAMDIDLLGGSGTFPGNERDQIDIEQASAVTLLTTLPIPPNTLLLRASSPAGGDLDDAVAAQIVALTAQVAALTSFLAYNPVPNDHVSAGDIADATAALASASAQLATTTAYSGTLAFPYSGYSDASLAARGAVLTARETFVDTVRAPQLAVILGFLWSRRFFWISQRARLSDGTLAELINLGKAATKMSSQIADNNVRIAEVMAILLAQ